MKHQDKKLRILINNSVSVICFCKKSMIFVSFYIDFFIFKIVLMKLTVKQLKDGIYIDVISENGTLLGTLHPTKQQPVSLKIFDLATQEWCNALLKVVDSNTLAIECEGSIQWEIFEVDTLSNSSLYQFWLN